MAWLRRGGVGPRGSRQPAFLTLCSHDSLHTAYLPREQRGCLPSGGPKGVHVGTTYAAAAGPDEQRQ